MGIRVAAWIGLLVPLLYAPLAFLTARRVVVRGRSMLPALTPGERVLFDRLAYETDEPRKGDIVLARHVARPRVLMIKRVIGDRPNGFFLLGDNVEASTDSRQLGPFRREDILARGWVVYWPMGRLRLVGRRPTLNRENE